MGTFGVLGFAVAQRRREIAIRMALGAGPRRIVGLFMSRTLATVLVGLAGGLAGSVVLGRLLATQLYEVRPDDPAALAGACVVVTGVALLAAFPVTRSAARVPPAESLRAE